MKMKKRVLAMAIEAPATLVKPSRPAIRPITRKITAHLSMDDSNISKSYEDETPNRLLQFPRGYFSLSTELLARWFFVRPICAARGVMQQFLGRLAGRCCCRLLRRWCR